MFPRRMFPGSYFAPTYFPPVSSDVAVVTTGHPPRGWTFIPPDPDRGDDDEFLLMLT